MRSIYCAFALFAVVACGLLAGVAEAVKLPNYAQGGDLSKIESTGRAITDTISLIVAILAIIGMLIGAGYYGVGNGEKGKTFLIGGVVALVIAGSVYGIAALAIR